MIKKLSILLVLLTVNFSTFAKEKYDFVYIDHLTEQKIGNQIITELYKRLDIPINTFAYPASRAQQAALLGKVDGEIMRIFAYGDENKNLIRVPTSYYTVKTMIFVHRDSGISITHPDELAKYSIVRVRGIKHTKKISNNAAHVFELSNSHELLNFVHLKRADIAITSAIEGKITLAKHGYNIVAMKNPIATLDLYHYIHKDNANLVPRIDNLIKSLKSSGELSDIIRQAEQDILGDVN